MNITMLLKKGFKLTAISSFFVCQLALATPEGAQVSAGSATVTQTTNQTTINQTSQNAVINWSNFNTSSSEAVLFNQPNSSAVALNRITSGLPTTFAGSLAANGQVWILNPAGVLFSSTSRVDVAGLLVTTHNIADSNFMSGHYQFDAVPGYENSKIINNGLITAKDSGLVALVAPGVENNGMIEANLGQVHLRSGSSFVLDLYGDQLINFGSSPAVQNGYVKNSGTIKATGGKVYMTANSAAQVVQDVVSMSGVIEATTTTTGQHGEIILNGGNSGVTRVSGKLNASDGGFIETSGHVLVIEPTKEINAGIGGTWLIDPANVTINGTATPPTDVPTGANPVTYTPTSGTATTNILNTDIEALLGAGTSVIVTTANSGASGGAFGDLTVAATIAPASSSGATLFLIANRDININAAITLTGQSLDLTATRQINLSAVVTTTNGSQIYHSPVVLPVDVSLTTTTGNISFLSTLNGSTSNTRTFVPTVTGGTLLFGGAVGNTNPLLTLTVTGPTQINSNITTSGVQTYNTGVVLGGNSILTSTAGTINFASTVDGPFNLTITQPSLFTMTSNFNDLGNLNAFTITNAADVQATGNTTKTTTTQTYNSTVTLDGLAAVTFQGSTITFNNTVETNVVGGTALTITGALSLSAAGEIGQGSTISSLSVSGATTTASVSAIPYIVTTGSQTYTGALNGTAAAGSKNLNLSSSAGSITLGPVGTTTTFNNVILSAASGIFLNGDVLTVGNQVYNNAVKIMQAGTTFAPNLTLRTTGGTLTFNGSLDGNTVHGQDVYLISPAFPTFTGTPGSNVAFLQFALSEPSFTVDATLAAFAVAQLNMGSFFYLGASTSSIIVSSPITQTVNLNPVTLTLAATTSDSINAAITLLGGGTVSLSSPSGLNLGANISAGGTQTFSNAVTLTGGPVTLTSSAGAITFSSTINGGFDLTINAATSTTFNNAIGGGIPLASLTVTAPSVITVNTSLIKTTGNQTFNGLVQFPQFVNPTFNSTVNGNITFNGSVSGSGNFQSVTVNAAGTANFFGTVGFPGDGMNFIDVTAPSGIFITMASGQRFGANQSITMRNNLVVNGSVTFQGGGLFSFLGTVDGPGSLSVQSGGGTIDFQGKIGSVTPLSALTADINNVGSVVIVRDEMHVTGAVSLHADNNALGPGFIYFMAPTPVTSTVGSITFITGTVYLSNQNISATSGQAYVSSVSGSMPSVVLHTDSTLSTSTGNILFWGPINNCVVGGGGPACSGALNNLVTSAPAGSVTFQQPLGGIAPFNNLTVNGTAVIATSGITTAGNQLYNNAVALNASSTFTSTGGNITIIGPTNGGGALSLSVPNTKAITFTGTVGATTALASLTTSATGTTYINGGQVRTTSGAQNYNNPVFIGAATTLGGAGTTGPININVALDSFDATPRALTLTTTGMTTLTGNLGATNILSGLTVTNAATLNVNSIHTTTFQTYNGALTLTGHSNLFTNAGGTLTFGSTIQGGFSLSANASSTGTVNFNNDIGTVGTPLTGLTVTGTAQINTNVAPTIFVFGTQTYNNNVSLNSLAAITFGSGIGSTTVFNGTVNRTVTSTAITIAGNLIVGPLGSIGLSSVIQSLLVNGTTLGPNVTTAGNQNYVGALTLNTNETMTSTGGSITYGSTVDGDGVLARNLTAIAATTVTFTGAVGNIVPLGALVVTGTTGININGGMVNTVNNQSYNNLVTIGSNLAITAGASGCSTTNCVQFTLGPIGVAGITGPTRNLSIFTFDASKGPTGAGIAGTVNVSGFTMGGTGGGNISPVVANYSTVGGSSGVGAWTNTVLDPAATGLYCVNGNCLSGSRVLTINANNASKTYGQLFTPTLFSASGLATGDSVSSLTLTSAGSPASANVSGSPYVINASNASGPGILNHYASIVYNSAAGLLTVNPAALTLTSTSQSKTFGTTLSPTTTFFTPTGLQNGETVGTVDIASAGLVGTASVAGSPYAITGVSNAAGGTFNPNNYAITYVAAGTITVTPNPVALTITSLSQTKNYGIALPSTTTFFTSTGLQGGDTIGTVDITSAGLAATAPVSGSPYPITSVSNAAGGTFNPSNYTITYTPAGSITVNPAALNLTSTSQSKNYGITLSPTTTFFTPTGLQNGETVGTVDIVSAGLAGTASVAGSPYAITGVSNAAGGTFNPNNYTITYTPAGSITVNPAALTLTSTSQSKNYGVTLSPTTTFFTPTGLQNGETVGTVNITSAGLSGTASVAGSPYAITAVSNAAGGTFNPNNYTITYTPAGSITVNPAALTLTSTSQVKNYGTILSPTTTFFTPTGLQNGETVGTIDIVSAGLSGTASVAGSPYAITGASNAAGGTFNPNNYTITYTPAGSITVNPAALTLTSTSQIKNYGVTLSPTTNAFTSLGLQNGETVGTINIVSAGLSGAASVAGSPYAITGASNAAGGTFNPNNYTITYTPAGTITVNPAALNLTSTSQVKNYGTILSPTTTFFTPTGLQNGETVGTINIVSAGLNGTASVAGSPYAITGASNAAGGTFNANNYTITYTPAGNITVNPVALNIASDSQTKNYGTTLSPTTTFFTPTGLQNGETIGTVDIVSAGLAPTANVAGSPYAITGVSNATGGTFNANNYIISYTPAGTITVNTATLNITPDSIVKTYGTTTPSTTTGFTPSGLQNGETVGTIDISSTGLAPTASVLGGPYAITGSNAAGGTFDPTNYTINYLPGATITVNPAALNIMSDSQIKNYGTTLSPTTTFFTPTGLQNGETVGTVDITSAGLSPTASVLGGPYAITGVSNATGGTFDVNNYAVTYTPAGTITVNPAALNITTDPQSKTYGTNLSPTTSFFTPTGLQNGETIGTVDIVSAGLPGAAPEGSYPITNVSNAAGGTFDPNNYIVSYVADGNINVIGSAPTPPIVVIDVPPTQIFTPPVGPNCGIAGCDNTRIIIIDILNGTGIREDIITYPVGIVPELIYSPDSSNILGVVTDSVGAPSEATNAQGITRELKIGSAIYKNDQLMVGGSSCVCMKTVSGEKKCKQHDEWSNTCKVGAGYQPAQKAGYQPAQKAGYHPAKKPIIKHHSLMQMFSLLELPSMKTDSKLGRDISPPK